MPFKHLHLLYLLSIPVRKQEIKRTRFLFSRRPITKGTKTKKNAFLSGTCLPQGSSAKMNNRSSRATKEKLNSKKEADKPSPRSKVERSLLTFRIALGARDRRKCRFLTTISRRVMSDERTPQYFRDARMDM
ncbi:hypothetical protein TNCV_1170811 [Trichonephila clavipes]|nr:hypothetical protein TNCV_1170811 [Trichonephila clavipes]